MPALGSLECGARFRWCTVLFSAQDRYYTQGSDGRRMRGVVYEQSLPAREHVEATPKGTLGLMPVDEEVAS